MHLQIERVKNVISNLVSIAQYKVCFALNCIKTIAFSIK